MDYCRPRHYNAITISITSLTGAQGKDWFRILDPQGLLKMMLPVTSSIHGYEEDQLS